jgi:hypothetical protein
MNGWMDGWADGRMNGWAKLYWVLALQPTGSIVLKIQFEINHLYIPNLLRYHYQILFMSLTCFTNEMTILR